MTSAQPTAIESYEQACAEHEWRVPERYNIAADVCDKHPRDKPAMVWERFDGATRELVWGELQDLANQAAHLLREHGIERGDRVAVVLPPTPETAAIFFGTWKLGAILLSMSVLYGDDGIRHRLSDSTPKLLVTDSANAARFDASLVDEILVIDDGLLEGQPTDHLCEDTSADDPAQLYYTSGTTGKAKGIVHAHRYILGHEEFVYCHDIREGERFHGMGEWAWAAGISPLLGPWRLGATQYVLQREGGFDPSQQLDFLSRHEVTNVFTTPTAMRSMMAIGDAGKRYSQSSRIVCSSESRSTRRRFAGFATSTGSRVDYYGLTKPPAGRRTSRSWRCARGRWGDRCPAGRCRSWTRTSIPSAPACAARSACAPGPTRTTPSATGTCPTPAPRHSAASGFTPRMRPRPTRTATSGTRAAPTT